MQIKNYSAKSISEAITKVKNDLGPDAIILGTKRIKSKQNGHLFEITALPVEANFVPDQYSELKSDLMSIKEMICFLNSPMGISEKLIMNPSVMNIYAKLIRNGVADQYARTFMERAGIFNNDIPRENQEDIQLKVAREIFKFIKVDDSLNTKWEGQKVLALIGTTGVGKTTTIAKMAAQFMLKDKKKVGLVSIDNYRIGAMEQLKAYANILGIPCFPAFNRKDLSFVFKKLAHLDVVLIDTAGQSMYDSPRISELREIITHDRKIRSYLLLSVSTSEGEMARTAVNFGSLNFQNYIFTKIDEAQNRGAILNQLMKLNLPISYLTNGQNVPDDIEIANRQKIVKSILNGR